MEEEIDLRQYVEVIKRWLWLIVLGATLAAGAAFVVSLFIPPTYEAEASVVLAKAKTEVTFDPNIKTVSSEQLARAIDQATQRQTLADLAGSTEIATRVVAKLGDLLSPEEQDVRTLTGMVEAKTDRNSNLIQLTVHSTDPEKAAKIANAWAKEYVDYVNNQVYSGTPQTPEEIAAQAKEAKAAYDKAETELVQFLGDNQLAELQRRLAEKKDIISSLQSGKKTAVTTVIDKELQARSQIIAAYIDAQAANRLVAFNKEQEGKRKLIEAYINAEIGNRLTAIQKDREARKKLFAQYVDQEIQNRLLAFQKDQEARSKLFIQYTNAELDNRLLAFQKDHEGRSKLFAQYVNAEIDNRLLAFQKDREAREKLFKQYVDQEIQNRLLAFQKDHEARSKIFTQYVNAEIDNRLLAFQKDQESRSKLFAQYANAEINNRLLAFQKEQEARSKLFDQYVNTEIDNRLLAFQKEQAAKKALFNAYTKADSTADTTIFEKQLDAKLQTLGDYYASKNKLDRILADAKSLRIRIKKGTESKSTGTGNSLAIVLLQASAFASSANLPVSLQVPMDQFTDLKASPSQQLHDLEALIATLEARQKTLQLDIDAQSKELLNNSGYKYLSDSTSKDNPLSKAIQQRYKELFQVGDVAKQSDTAPATGDLAKAIIKRYDTLFGTGDLSKQADQAPAKSDLSKAITRRYSELFGIGSLSKEADQALAQSDLSKAIIKKYNALFTVDNLSKQADTVSADSDLAKAIIKRYNELFGVGNLPKAVDTASVGSNLAKAITEKYDQLFAISDLSKQADQAPVESDLAAAIAKRYNELFGVDELSKQADQAPLSSDLTKAIMARYNELFDVGDLAKAAETVTTTTPLFTTIRKKYPYLFETGDLSKLTESVTTDNPLATAAKDKSRALLQMEGLDQVVTYSTTDAPMTQAINQLQQEVNRLQAQIEKDTAHKQELTRARDLAHETYKSLARKVAEVDVATQSKSTEVKFAVPAVAPRAPVAPRKMMNTLLAGVVGLMLMLGIAFVAEFMDDSLRPDDVERLLQLPTTAQLPSWKGTVPDGRPVALAEPQAPFTEALRSLRTNLQVLTSEPLRSLLVTSPDPEEGKSTVIANLGVVIAQAGKKVVLVEGDLRRPTLHKHFGLPTEKGLSNLLVEKESSVADLLQETEVPGLRLLASGPLPPNPADLLSNDRLATILEAVQAEADVVLVDSPAALVITDALLLAKRVEGVLLVAEPGATGREAAVQVRDALTQAGAHVLGVVLTRVKPESVASYQYYAGNGKRRGRSRSLLSTLRQWAGTWGIFS